MSFAFAVVPRLVECCTKENLHGASTDSLAILPVLDSLVADAKSAGLTVDLEDFDVAGHELIGLPQTAQRVLAIAGLIELGLTVGYLDLNADESPIMSAILEGPFRAFQEGTLSSATPAALTALSGNIRLFDRLMKRLTAENLSATPGNEELAGVFESYVNLTSCVWSDRAFHQFLFDTHGTSSEWILDDDLALFVTPRHFAAAIATGSIGEKPAPAAEGGLAALKYFDWLSEIVASAGASPVADDFIRHARWAHSVDRVSARLEAWASAMSEWRGAERDVEERRAWRRYVERVFESLTMRQRKLDIPRIEPQSYWGGSSPGAIGVPPSFEDVNNQVRSLKAQGRIGAARRVAVEAASKLYDGLSQQDATWLPRSGELVNICSLISELGDVDVAAAYVAPVRERAELIGSGLHFPSGVADHVLLAARTSPVTEQTSATTIEVSSTIPPVRTQQTQVPRTRITNARREPTNLS